MAGRGRGSVVWSFVGLCEKGVSHFADSEEKLSSYTERTVGKNYAEANLFSTLQNQLRQKTSNSDQQLNVSLVCRPRGRLEQGKHHAQIKTHPETW